MNIILLAGTIRHKMWEIMSQGKNKLSDIHFAGLIGISKATLSRILNYKEIDLKSLIKVCKWLNRPIDDFINK